MKTFRYDFKEMSGQFVVVCYRMTPKGRFPEAVEFAYRFKTAEAREAYVNKFKAEQEAREASAQARKEAKSNAQKNFVNPFKVGEIFYHSWGYDQTNINFYQIVEVGKKSVKIREIAQSIVEGSEGNMCENVVPVKDSFVGEVIVKMVKVYVSYDGKTVSEPSFGFWKMTEEKMTKGIYQSHYA